MRKPLFEIADEIRLLKDGIEALLENPDVSEEANEAIQEYMDTMVRDYGLRFQDCYYVITEWEGFAEILDKEARKLSNGATAFKNAAKRLKTTMTRAMEISGMSEVQGNRLRAKLQQSPPKLIVDDEQEALRLGFQKVEVDNAALRKAVIDDPKKYENLAHLERGNHIRFYISKYVSDPVEDPFSDD